MTVNYTAEGIPDTLAGREQVRKERGALALAQTEGNPAPALPAGGEAGVMMSALTDYFKTTAERVKFDDLKEQTLRNAYISGTGVLYTYWDSRVRTGLYADESRQVPITGDLAARCWILRTSISGIPISMKSRTSPISSSSSGKAFGICAARPGGTGVPPGHRGHPADRDTAFMAGDRAEEEPADSRKATVITKFWKEWDKEGTSARIKAAVAVRGALIRGEWDTGAAPLSLRGLPLGTAAQLRLRRERNHLSHSQSDRHQPHDYGERLGGHDPGDAPDPRQQGNDPDARITNDPGQIIEVDSVGMAACTRRSDMSIPPILPRLLTTTSPP